MTEAAKLYHLIESVDKDDTDTLDEINDRFFCWLSVSEELKYVDKDHARINGLLSVFDWNSERVDYVRSLDAIKAVENTELQGWEYMGTWNTPTGYSGKMIKLKYDKDNFKSRDIVLGEFGENVCATEYLARLHAVIQAIKYERSNETR